MDPVGAPQSRTRSASRRDRHRLLLAIGCCLLGAAVVGYCQRDHFNADFVAYATIAQRVLACWRGELPFADVVAGYWAPLYSWAMAPLLALGASDLLAGRLVLVVAGLGYLVAVDRLLFHLRRHGATAGSAAAARGEFVHTAVLTGATVQATLWAQYLLDPDLLGAAFSMAALATIAGGGAAPSGPRCFGVGLLAGCAYLGKSFQLPFLTVLVPVALWWLPARAATGVGAPWSVPRWWPRVLAAAGGGLLIALPWIALLTARYGRLTISTAGPANHANVGPGVRGQDLLWTPPLEPAYILDPHLGPDWSPFASWTNAAHQAMLVVVNCGHATVLLGGPVLLLLSAAIARQRAVPRDPAAALVPSERAVVRLFVLAAVVFVLGYASIQVGRRYLLATLAPMVSLAGFTLLGGVPAWLQRRVRSAAAQRSLPVLLGLLVAGQELRLLWTTASRHPQSEPWSQAAALADELRTAGLAGRRFAADRWHEGLSATYALAAVDRYYGTPLAAEPDARAGQLAAVGVDCFLHFAGGAAGAPAPLPPPWQRVLRSAAVRHDGHAVEVYVLAP